MRRLHQAFAAMVLAAAALTALVSAADLPKHTGYVNDFAGVLGAAAVAAG